MTNNMLYESLETILFKRLGFGITGLVQEEEDSLTIVLPEPMSISTLNSYLKSVYELHIKKPLVFQRNNENNNLSYTVYDENEPVFSLIGQAEDIEFTIQPYISQKILKDVIQGA